MEILLLGNGLELAFNDKMSKKSMIAALNQGNLSSQDNVKNNLIKLNEEIYGPDDKLTLDDFDYRKIAQIINGEVSCKSIEEIFNDIDYAIDDEDKIYELECLFLSFLQRESGKIPAENNEIADLLSYKFMDYDVIVTTNYTDLIEKILRNVPQEKKPYIIHIHGKFNGNNTDDILLGREKIDSKDETEKQIRDTLDNWTNRLISKFRYPDNTKKINISTYGWCLEDEEDILSVLIRWSLRIVLSKYVNKNDPNLFNYTYDRSQQDITDEELNDLVNVNYYSYVDDDKTNFENWVALLNGDEYETYVDLIGPESENDWDWGNMIKNVDKDYNHRYIQHYENGHNFFETDNSKKVSVTYNAFSSYNFIKNKNRESIIWDIYSGNFVDAIEAEGKVIKDKEIIAHAAGVTYRNAVKEKQILEAFLKAVN